VTPDEVGNVVVFHELSSRIAHLLVHACKQLLLFSSASEELVELRREMRA
jgi:hypothetical protein